MLPHLRRYTELPALVNLLSSRTLTLLDPQSWDDKNDSYYLNVYRERKALQSVLALCFTQADETYHHWRIFAPGSGGVCIKFRHEPLMKAIGKQVDIRMGDVRYLTLPQLHKKTLGVDELPFLKRYAFQHEKEFRLLHESKTQALPKLEIDIPLSCIERITLSPWMHSSLAPGLKALLKSIPGCSKVDVYRSTLIANEDWKRKAETAM